MAGNKVYVRGNYVDVHDNGVVNLNIDKATVSVDESKGQKEELSGGGLHFGLDAKQLAHWADVYSHLVTAGMIKKSEVSSENFTWLLCGEGTAPLKPIRWYKSTRALAYMVRVYLNSKWEVAITYFKDKNDSKLPESFKNSSAPSQKSREKIDQIFHT
jgi:hypothetical protein